MSTNNSSFLPVPEAPNDMLHRTLAILKLVIASAVVATLITVIIIGVCDRYCILQLPPVVNFFILLCCVTLLAYVEGTYYEWQYKFIYMIHM